jgi:hypothetical protein
MFAHTIMETFQRACYPRKMEDQEKPKMPWPSQLRAEAIAVFICLYAESCF